MCYDNTSVKISSLKFEKIKNNIIKKRYKIQNFQKTTGYHKNKKKKFFVRYMYLLRYIVNINSKSLVPLLFNYNPKTKFNFVKNCSVVNFTVFIQISKLIVFCDHLESHWK